MNDEPKTFHIDVPILAEANRRLEQAAQESGRNVGEILSEIIERELPEPAPGEYIPDESDDPTLDDRMGRVISDLIMRTLPGKQ